MHLLFVVFGCVAIALGAPCAVIFAYFGTLLFGAAGAFVGAMVGAGIDHSLRSS